MKAGLMPQNPDWAIQRVNNPVHTSGCAFWKHNARGDVFILRDVRFILGAVCAV